MSSPLTSMIREEAQKLVERHQRYAANIAENFQRKIRRGISPSAKVIHSPSYWGLHPGFNPYHVRSNAETIAYAIRKALRTHTYQPCPAVWHSVPKGLNDVRKVSVFQIADNAISRAVYKSLLNKNAPRLSARCYAYRTDVTVHDAVLHLASDLRGRSRVFVAEFDFSKYFDSISHEYILELLSDKRFYITKRELEIVRSFLSTPTHEQSSYDLKNKISDKTIGIPQGTSISLFLANIAAYPMDRRLESLGVDFVRYADDTVIWSSDYSKICSSVAILEQSAKEMGVLVNLKKSEGVTLVTGPSAPSEMKSKRFISFVGYQICTDRIGIKHTSVSRIKKELSYLVYSNLVQGVKKGKITPSRFANPIDRDYLTMHRQLRRYLYGNLNETQLKKYLARQTPRIQYKGLMSFYPIIDDFSQLKDLDGWLLHTVHTALKLRTNILKKAGHTSLPHPHGLSKPQLINFQGRSTKGAVFDLKFPSFVRVARLVTSAANAHGANQIANPKSGQYYPV